VAAAAAAAKSPLIGPGVKQGWIAAQGPRAPEQQAKQE